MILGVSRRAMVAAAVAVLILAIAVPVLAWLASPAPTKHTVRAARCERGRVGPGHPTHSVSVTPKESGSLSALRRVVTRQEDRCCPQPRAAQSRADATEKLRARDACLAHAASTVSLTSTDPKALVPKSRRLVIGLGRDATCDDQR